MFICVFLCLLLLLLLLFVVVVVVVVVVKVVCVETIHKKREIEWRDIALLFSFSLFVADEILLSSKKKTKNERTESLFSPFQK